MIAPLALVGDVHAFLALAEGRRQRAVGVDHRPLEECRRLELPDAQAHLVDRVHQRLDVRDLESPAEVALGGRVGNTLGAQGVQVRLLIALKLDVLKAGASDENVVGEVQHVVRFVIGLVLLQQVQVPVDHLDQPAPPGEQVHGPDPAGG